MTGLTENPSVLGHQNDKSIPSIVVPNGWL